MNLADVSVFDIVSFIFKVFLAIGIIVLIFEFFEGLGKFFSKVFPDLFASIFKYIWSCLRAIGFRNSLWNLAPLIAVFIYIFAAILSLLSNHPNAWPWWKYALPGALLFGITLAINVYIGKFLGIKSKSSKLNSNTAASSAGDAEDESKTSSNLYCFPCSRKLGLKSNKKNGRFYCDACFKGFK